MIGPIPVYLNSEKNGNTLGNNSKFDTPKKQALANNSTTSTAEAVNSASTSGYGSNRGQKSRKHFTGGLEFPAGGSGLGSRMVFQAIKVIPPFTDDGDKVKSAGTVTDIKNEELSKEDQKRLSESAEDFLGTTSNLQVKSIKGEKATLYVPPSFLSTDSFDYSTANLGVAGMAGMQALRNSGGVMDAVMEGIKGGFSGIMDVATKGLATEAGKAAAVRVANAASSTAGAAVSLATGIAPNPNLRSTFSSAGIREFNFQFKMIASSPEESANIQNIVKFFRFHSYPDQVAVIKGVSAALEYPNLFQIKIQSLGTDKRYKHVGTPIKLCYCKSVSVTYNATSSVLHYDGSPTEVDLTVTFQEYRPLNRDDIRNEDTPQFYYYEGKAIQDGE